MLRQKTNLARVLVLAGLLTACGHSDPAPVVAQGPAPVNSPDTSSFIGGLCGDQVTQDYRRLSAECHFDTGMRGRTDDACRGEAEDFLHKYPAVSCALDDRSPGGRRQGSRIEARDLQPFVEGTFTAR